MSDISDRSRGCLLGLACGDAVGTTLEFRPPGTFAPISGMAGGGPFGLKPGQWTDDTSMALCLAESLVEKDGHDPEDQMRRYLFWRDRGHLSSTGRCFDIGGTVAAALSRYERTGDPYSGSADSDASGNGSLMRLAPVAIFFSRDPLLAASMGVESSRTTHASPECLDACAYFAWLLARAILGETKPALLSPKPDGPTLATPKIRDIASGSFLRKDPPDIRGTGYVAASLEAALWAFAKGRDFRESVLLAANLGDDADTTAAICGQIAGAHHGESGIPGSWLAKLHMAEEIRAFATRLARLEAP